MHDISLLAIVVTVLLACATGLWKLSHGLAALTTEVRHAVNSLERSHTRQDNLEATVTDHTTRIVRIEERTGVPPRAPSHPDFAR